MTSIIHEQRGILPEKFDDDAGSTSSSSSADTNEAFLDMLGLPALDGISVMADENDCLENEAIRIRTPIHPDDCMTPSVTPLEVPHRCSRYLHQPSDVAAFVIDNLLGVSDCQELIQLAIKLSSTGFHYVTEAAHTDNEGVTHMVKLQEANKHKLFVFEHAPTLERLWNKLKPIILPQIGPFMENTQCGPPLGLNPRLRVLRYDAHDSDVFEPHFDATTRVGNTTSLLTILIYLNDGGGIDFDGGETCYMDALSPKGIDSATKITPLTGKVVVFEHDLFHSSVPLKFGTKYVLRTDVLFELDNAQTNGGVDKPRGSIHNKIEGPEDNVADTLLEVCQQLMLTDEAMSALDEIGLLDLTLDSLFAPGVSAVRQMMKDVLDEQLAEQLVNAALECR